jgi:hypothetical protein
MQLLDPQYGIPGDFFNVASLGTLAGATGAVYIVCGTIQKVFNYNPKWLALLVSVLISFLVASVTATENSQLTKYIVALLNGFLIYATATGTNQILGKQDNKEMHRTDFRQNLVLPRQFNTRWW